MANKNKETKKAEPKKEEVKVKVEPKLEMVMVLRLNPKTGNRDLMEVAKTDMLLSQNGDVGMKDILAQSCYPVIPAASVRQMSLALVAKEF